MNASKEHQEILTFRKKLFEQLKSVAFPHSTDDLVDALYDASEDVWASGIDDAYAQSNGRLKSEVLADAFDITWLTAVIIRLAKKK